MKKNLKSWMYFLGFILFIYLIVNIEIFLWHIVNPEGFWGVCWFSTLSSMCIYSLTMVATLLGYLVFEYKHEKGNKKLVLAGVGFFVIGSIIEFGPQLFINHRLYNKYQYTERSEEYFAKGQFEKALKYAEKVYVKSLNKELPPPFFFIPYFYEKSRLNHIDHYFNIYNTTLNYAYCLQASGKDINKAVRLYKSCIAICQNYFPVKTDYMVLPLSGCLNIYMTRGNRQQSDSTYLVLSRYLNKLDKHDVTNTISALLFYSIYKRQNGELENMLNLQKQALSIYEKDEYDDLSSIHLLLRTMVISSYLDNNDLISAVKMTEDTETIAGKNKEDASYLKFLIVKFRIFSHSGKSNEESEILNEISGEIKDRQGENSLEYSLVIYNQGMLCFNKGLLKSADSYFKKSIKIATPYLNEQPENYYDILLGSALCDYTLGNKEKSIEKLSKVNSYLLQNITTNLIFLTEDEKENYVLSITRRLNTINSIYVLINNPSLNERLYDNILATKGIALQSNQFFKQIIQSSGQNNLISRYNMIKNKSESVKGMRRAGVQNQLILSQLETAVLQSEKLFIQTFVNTSTYKSVIAYSIHWDDIRNKLKKDEVAIEYLSTSSLKNLRNQSEYFALIIKPNSQFPILIPLFNEKAITEILKVDGNIPDKINTIYSGDSFNKIYNQVWKPLLPYISGSKTVFISLSGVLHQLSFPAITAKEPFNIVCLSNTRNIIPGQKVVENSQSREATLYGDINYNESNAVSSSHSLKNKIIQPPLNNFITRSGFQSLPFTKIEIDNISNLLLKDKYKVRRMVGSYATKESFKELHSFHPNILHVATHGFYYPQSQINHEFGISSLYTNSLFETQNPLFRSGLLLAGANKNSKNTPFSDGIINAYEISKLDLSSTDLVVLSACETGLGELRGDEGVFGLQRAFKIAGVKSIIMSLWKIPDQQTAQLMQYFYKYYISGKSKNESLKLAQQKIRVKYPNPYYWAAFVLID